ncbi:MAG: hypothetical protein OCD01_05105 [Fibrobacterales bacterium]
MLKTISFITTSLFIALTTQACIFSDGPTASKTPLATEELTLALKSCPDTTSTETITSLKKISAVNQSYQINTTINIYDETGTFISNEQYSATINPNVQSNRSFTPNYYQPLANKESGFYIFKTTVAVEGGSEQTRLDCIYWVASE